MPALRAALLPEQLLSTDAASWQGQVSPGSRGRGAGRRHFPGLRTRAEGQASRRCRQHLQQGCIPREARPSAWRLTPLERPAGYDEEARYFDRGVSSAQREELHAGCMGVLQPAFAAQARLAQAAALELGQARLKDCLAAASFADAAAKCVAIGGWRMRPPDSGAPACVGAASAQTRLVGLRLPACWPVCAGVAGLLPDSRPCAAGARLPCWPSTRRLRLD